MENLGQIPQNARRIPENVRETYSAVFAFSINTIFQLHVFLGCFQKMAARVSQALRATRSWSTTAALWAYENGSQTQAARTNPRKMRGKFPETSREIEKIDQRSRRRRTPKSMFALATFGQAPPQRQGARRDPDETIAHTRRTHPSVGKRPLAAHGPPPWRIPDRRTPQRKLAHTPPAPVEFWQRAILCRYMLLNQ